MDTMGKWRYFGTDGVRGVANGEVLTPEFALRLGKAHGSLLGVGSKVVIGRDTRVSGPMLESAYVAGLNSCGVEALLLGVVPTPVVAFMIRSVKAEGGAVVSASHNPVEYNGIKLFDASGHKLGDEAIESVEALLASPSSFRSVTSTRIAGVRNLSSEPYVDDLVRGREHCLRGMKVVLDCAYGAAGALGPETFRRLGASVIALNTEPDGSKINVKCGSTDMAELARVVVEEKADCGLAFDGDADRCLAVDEKGGFVDGDQMMLILATHLRQQGRLENDLVVATVMSNLGLELALQERGISLIRTKVGDRYVLEALRKYGGVLGGEQSGHIVVYDRSTTGDGILSGILLALCLREQGKPLSVLAAGMKKYPQKLINIKAEKKELLESDRDIAYAIERFQRKLSGKGRILVRPSGTEPLIRVMGESTDAELLDKVLGELVGLIEQRLGA